MSDKLQQAIQATRVGDKKNAQFLLTQAIQDEPDNPQSWYLLSLLVDDETKQQAYLTKVLDLDPDHIKAHEKLVAITETAVPKPKIIELEEAATEMAPVILSSNSGDLEAQDEGKTLPDWMADDLPDISDDTTSEVTETAVVAEKEPVPDWLQDSVEDNWDEDETKTAVADDVSTETTTIEDKKPQEKKAVAVKETKPAKPKKSSEANLNYMLIGLVVFAVIIFLILAYLIITMM